MARNTPISLKFPEHRERKSRCFEIMLRKRTRSLQKDSNLMAQIANSDASSDYYSQSHSLGRNIKSNSIFNVPRVFVGLGPKGLLDSDSIRSPTSPLDVRVLSNLGNTVRTPRTLTHEGNQRSWDCSKVGLSIIDSLEDCSRFSGKILRSSESKNPSLSPKMSVKTPNCQAYTDSFEESKSLPKDFGKPPYTRSGSMSCKGESNVLFEIGETHVETEPFGKTRSCSLDSGSPFKTLSGLTHSNTDMTSRNFDLNDMMNTQVSSPRFFRGSQNSSPLAHTSSNPVSICSSNEFVGSLSAGDIELSEDYTCVISRGPNPKTTHIFGDCILETHSNDLINHGKKEKNGILPPAVDSLITPNHYPSSDFLSFCHHCNKKLEEGKDIYIYRGEKSFCSLSCRALEIMIDEELEKESNPSENSPKRENGILMAT
ncbi:FCS-Like Zinc finger 10-like [Senna tora]|uniref:FCS-Like Zinc finger 10-like n=1 Tax=Senna tora TaxID=362788 RepID=A0A834U1H4_9FABA|nr:FCS-Like Zinc finger 10-like [Senna tora]